MELEHRIVNGVAVVSVAGEMRGDPEHDQQLQALVKQLLADGVLNAVLELSQVKWINSSGLGQILAMFDTLRRGGGSLRMARPNERIAKVLETTRFSKVIPTFDTEDEAVSSLQKAS